MKRKVIRDAGGKLINIGEWELVLIDEPILAQGGEDLGPLHDVNGKLVGRRLALPGEVIGFTGRKITSNPLPEGAYEDEAEIVTGYDGGLYEATDPRAARA